MSSEFSSVSMRILSPDGKTVLAELQTIDRAAQRTARNAGDTTSAALSQVQQRAAVGARQIATNVAQIASVGSASAQSLSSIVAQGSNIAFMFGAGGAIAGAIGITALAIVSLFKRTRDEIEATSRKAMEELGRLAEAGNIGSIGGRFGVATKLFSGDRFAARQEDESEAAFFVRQRGIAVARAEIARLEGIVQENLGGGGIAQSRRQTARNRIHELQRALDLVVPRYEKLVALMREMEGIESATAARTVSGRKVSFTESEAARLARTQDQLLGAGADIGLLRGPAGQRFASINAAELWPQMVEQMRAGLKKTSPLPPQEMTEDLMRLMAWDQVVEGMGAQLGMTLADGIANGITAAIQTGNIGEAFKAMTGTILEGIGSMMIEAGTHALAFAKMWARLQAWLAANPVAAIPVAIGLIAAGSAVRALGSSMRGSASGFGGGGSFSGGGFGSGQTIIDRGLINPLNGVVTSPGTITPRTAINLTAIIYGSPNDPVMQRHFLDVVDKANARRGG